MVAFMESNPSQATFIHHALPNDPSYLMDKTSCPAPFNDKPMFNRWGDENYEINFPITYNGTSSEVKIRFSYAKEEARQGYNPGGKPHGQHAAKNVGVSVIRANRELDLDQAWVLAYDTRERWWGVEVEFPPALDEIFGVTNNKQFANNFSELGKLDIDELLRDGKTLIQLKEELEEENDPKAFLIEIANKIDKQLSNIRGVIKSQSKSLEKVDNARHKHTTTAEEVATEATKERRDEGHTGTSDTQEQKPEEERKAEVEKALINDGVPNPTEIVNLLFKTELKYQFVEYDFDGPAFFTVRSRGGKILISLNTNHPAYHKLVEVLDQNTDDATPQELQARLNNASEGLKLLLMAWARYEDEQPDGQRKTNAQDARTDWGRIARQFLQED